MALQLNVTSQTTIRDLDAFSSKVGDQAKIRGKVEKDGSITLYASTRKSGAFDWLAKLFGGASRKDKQEAGQRAIETILRNSSSLGEGTHQKLVSNLWGGVPHGRGQELRTDGLQKVVDTSRDLLSQSVEFMGKTYNREKQLGSDGFGVVDLYRSEDGESIVLKRPKVEMGTMPNTPLEKERHLEFVNRERDTAYQELREEIALYRHIQQAGGHPNVLPMLGELTGPMGEPILVLPLMPNGDAFSLGNSLCGALEQGRVDGHQGQLMGLTMLKDVGDSLQHLHERAGVLHLDMKPENYLVDGEGRLQLMDFGTSMVGVEHQLKRLPVDIPRYYPPEVLIARVQRKEGDIGKRDRINEIERQIRQDNRTPGTLSPEHRTELLKEQEELRSANAQIKAATTIPVNEKSDSWALGIMAYRLLVDNRSQSVSPFFHETDNYVGKQLERTEAFGKSQAPLLDQVALWYPDDEGLRARIGNLSPEVKELVNGLLHPDPEQRMSVQQALLHPLFQQQGVGSSEIRRQLVGLQ